MLKDGHLVWETASPGSSTSLNLTAEGYAPPTVVGDVVLVGRAGFDNASDGYSFQYSKGEISGKLLHETELETNFHGGIAVQGKHVMWGTGYATAYIGNGTFSMLRKSGNKPFLLNLASLAKWRVYGVCKSEEPVQR